MGDPKKIRKKYTPPSHPWQKARIESEKIIVKEFGVKNKKEIWKIDAFLRSIHSQAKSLIIATSQQAMMEKQNLIKKLQKYGLISAEGTIDQILGLTLHDIMNRRLQSLVVKKGLAKTVSQARQMITHKHIAIGEKKISSPSYLVTLEEEGMITYAQGSSFSNPEHAERAKMHA
jgi:small subunit ribosomal protein S4